MRPDVDIRLAGADDLAGLELLYPLAFPDEDLLPVVRELSALSNTAPGLVAVQDDQIIGHIVFTACSVGEDSGKVYLLGPLAVAPAVQKRGIGKALIAEGMKMLATRSATQVFVLGDPNYYGRSGFEAEYQILPPYDLPAEWEGAWQSRSISAASTGKAGRLSVPPVWDKRELWLP